MPEKWVKDKESKDGYTYRKIGKRKKISSKIVIMKLWWSGGFIFPKIMKKGCFNDDS